MIPHTCWDSNTLGTKSNGSNELILRKSAYRSPPNALQRTRAALSSSPRVPGAPQKVQKRNGTRLIRHKKVSDPPWPVSNWTSRQGISPYDLFTQRARRDGDRSLRVLLRPLSLGGAASSSLRIHATVVRVLESLGGQAFPPSPP